MRALRSFIQMKYRQWSIIWLNKISCKYVRICVSWQASSLYVANPPHVFPLYARHLRRCFPRSPLRPLHPPPPTAPEFLSQNINWLFIILEILFVFVWFQVSCLRKNTRWLFLWTSSNHWPCWQNMFVLSLVCCTHIQRAPISFIYLYV